MIAEAQRHAEEDRRRKEHAELKNALDTARIQAERLLGEKQGTPEARSRLEAAVQRAKELVEKDASDPELKAATQELLQAVEAYEKSASTPGASGRGPDDVIDADYKPAE